MVEREAWARKNPNYDGVCFHAQQCAEKYLKALAVELDLPFLRTHDLVILLEELLPVYPLWASATPAVSVTEEAAETETAPSETSSRFQRSPMSPRPSGRRIHRHVEPGARR